MRDKVTPQRMELHSKDPSKIDFGRLRNHYNYQAEVTPKLDAYRGDFDQQTINEIVHWKVDRYAGLSEQTIGSINNIDPESTTLDRDLTRVVLRKLLETSGVRLPMASTILRFRNPRVYQIIDQRVYRVVYGAELRLSTLVEKNIDQYLAYLEALAALCARCEIPYSESDRILYEFDKEYARKNIRT